MFRKVLGIAKGLLKQGKDGVAQPLPLTGIVNAFKEAKESKQWFKFGMYVVTGAYTIYLLYKGLSATEALNFITSILEILG